MDTAIFSAPGGAVQPPSRRGRGRESVVIGAGGP